MTVRLGFLGTGFIARYHAWSLAESRADAVIVAAFDPDHDRAREFTSAHGGTAVSSEDAVVEAADAVYVCTWTSEHRRLVEAVAAAGRAVFCEKPLATDLEAARKVVAAVDAAGVVSQVGLVLRSSPALLELVHQVRHPACGRIQAVVLRDDQFLPVQGMYGSSWRADPARAGSGTLLEHSIHDVDVLEWLAGPATSVSARAGTFHGNPGIEDTVTAAFGFEDGTQATLTSVWHQLLARPSLRRVEVICEHAFLTLEHDVVGPVTWQRADGEAGSLEGEELVAEVRERHGGRYPNQDRAFVDAVASGRPGDAPDVHTALRAHEVVDAAYRSIAAGGTAVACAAHGSG